MDFHSPESIAHVLAVCSEITNLAFRDLMGGPTLLPILDPLLLQRLSIAPYRLFFGMERMVFTRPLFSRITHLDILDWHEEGWAIWSGLAQMPCLTHLSFSYHDFTPYRTCRDILQNCKALEVLAVLCAAEEMLPRFLEQGRDLDSDPRFVVVVVQDDLLDWEIGAQGGKDYWSMADEMVMQRRLTMAVPDRLGSASGM
ncbi:hypothetical protein B0H16DRAFT_1465578 [Mycena metata]|uniref:Uncharacterized protein n=1 Tax=Mycena metata TaxID=1033252 RepID=A0AAD7ICI0_9AGAR|nr:hypothetical protein B0H16DRAFT_1465578 [Mycena metata]